jgi:transposase InsO family protein
VSHKKIQRLWREKGLQVPHRRRRKRLGTSSAPNPPTADAPDRVWRWDFQFDATTDGRPVNIASVVDEHTRECLGGLVERSVTAGDHVSASNPRPARTRHQRIISPLPAARAMCCALKVLPKRSKRGRRGLLLHALG